MTKKLVFLTLVSVAIAAGCSEQTRPTPEPIAPTSADLKTQTTPAGTPTPAPPNNGPASAETRQKLIELMSGIEHMPSKEEFLRIAPENQVVAVLSSVLTDGKAKMMHRTQAVAGLRFFPTPESRATFEALLTDTTTSELLLRPGVKAYATAFGNDAVPVASKLLAHTDRNTRESAVRALAEVGTPAARKAVEARLPVEQDTKLQEMTKTTLASWQAK
jgi:hypothetical protein